MRKKLISKTDTIKLFGVYYTSFFKTLEKWGIELTIAERQGRYIFFYKDEVDLALQKIEQMREAGLIKRGREAPKVNERKQFTKVWSEESRKYLRAYNLYRRCCADNSKHGGVEYWGNEAELRRGKLLKLNEKEALALFSRTEHG